MQYLLNASAIWLISLVVFDVFLRKESYHSYNRMYLLGTFLLGLLLPLISWSSDGWLQPALQQPIENIVAAKETVVAKTTESVLDFGQWLMIVYVAGMLAALAMLLVEIGKLTTYYHGGKKWKYEQWTIIETGMPHAPFSLFRMLFVTTRQQYSEGEWQMLFEHEQRHTALVHAADVLLMQLARIGLWFHPLVYIYNNRLLMVHEYQADVTTAATSNSYGHFLVEQAILGATPALTHSFNRSPIKNRIIMLTRRSSRAARTKMLALVPVVAAGLLLFSQNVFSQKMERKGNMVTYKGNKFELSKEQVDTIEMQDPVSGEIQTRVVKMIPQPIKMNGKKVYHGDGVNTDYVGANGNLRTAMLLQMKGELVRLQQGEYRFNLENLTVDEKGAVVYFENGGITGIGPNHTVLGAPPVDGAAQKRIKALIDRALNGKLFRPGIKDGKPVPAAVTGSDLWTTFKIEDHKLYDKDASGNWVLL